MTATTGTPAKWENVSAGPRQFKDLQRAMSRLQGEGRTRTELYGVAGGKEHGSAVMSLMGPVRAEVTALDEAIRAKYGSQVTRENVRQVIADYEAALPEAQKSRPVDDQRRTQDEEAVRLEVAAVRDAEWQAKQAAEQAVMAQVMAKAPAGAKRLIFADYEVDASDIQTDYFASHTAQTVAIGWAFSAREDFRALHAAAAAYPKTAHLGTPDEGEHRENYSMGGGNFLSDHGSRNRGTGWVVRSASIPCSYVHLTEDAIPGAQAAPAAAPASVGGVTVSPSSLGREGVVEVRFADKPAQEVLDGLKARGFRWARGNRCWYGSDVAYAESLASAS